MRKYIFTAMLLMAPYLGLYAISLNSELNKLTPDTTPLFDKNVKAKNIYFISGLGADKSVFRKLDLDPAFNLHYIEWVKPYKKESLENYAYRLISQIDTTQPFQLIGMSFGGIMATYIAKKTKPVQTILISSPTKNTSQKGFNRFLIKFILAGPISNLLLKNPVKETYKRFGAITCEEKKLLKTIFKNSDMRFMKWALNRIIDWHGVVVAPHTRSINGGADRMVPPGLASPDYIIPGGGHLMVYSHAAEVSKIINAWLLQPGK